MSFPVAIAVGGSPCPTIIGKPLCFSILTFQNFFSRQGELAPEGCWVARYQVRQPQKAYWYYKLPASLPTFTTTTETPKLSKYKHLGKAGSQSHVEEQ
jgi:hypothetical protein